MIFPGTYHLEWDQSVPQVEDEDLALVPIFQDIKLSQINYKCQDNLLDLTAIQLTFSNGFSTPLFEVQAP